MKIRAARSRQAANYGGQPQERRISATSSRPGSDLDEFLSLSHSALLASVRPDGGPHATPGQYVAGRPPEGNVTIHVKPRRVVEHGRLEGDPTSWAKFRDEQLAWAAWEGCPTRSRRTCRSRVLC